MKMMNFKQNLTVLFWLCRQKVKADGKAPICARITIDGKYTEISTGKKVNPASWDLDVKQVTGWRIRCVRPANSVAK